VTCIFIQRGLYYPSCETDVVARQVKLGNGSRQTRQATEKDLGAGSDIDAPFIHSAEYGTAAAWRRDRSAIGSRHTADVED
jgi:hypothetical protein